MTAPELDALIDSLVRRVVGGLDSDTALSQLPYISRLEARELWTLWGRRGTFTRDKVLLSITDRIYTAERVRL